MPEEEKIKVKTSFATITPESAEEGDFAETGWIDEEGVELDDVEEVIKFLRDEGAMMPSSTCFCKGVWYDSEEEKDLYTGESEIKSFHISNATEEEEESIYKELFPAYHIRCEKEK